ncbi:tyrosinase [Ceratobasidium sp. AG-Ba]|nr:tyrosinase [Ceratobasidium sp. AG-Ba]
MRLPTLVSFFAVAAFSAVVAQNVDSLRVRKEWRSLSDNEKKEFLNAVKCLGNKPHGKLTLTNATPGIPPYNNESSLYDDFVYTHMDVNFKVHFTALFLAWHRWFLWLFEKTLHEKCKYRGTIPFWDWSKDVSGGIPNSSIFNSSKTYGLGTLPPSGTNAPVTDGVLWNTTRAYPEPHIITREYTPYPWRLDIFPFPIQDRDVPVSAVITPQKVDELVMGSAGNYTNFQYMLDGVNAQGVHSAPHLVVGGDMPNLYWSTNDVLFWLHHGQLDCIWARWQANKTENALAFSGGLTQNVTYYDQYPLGTSPLASLDSELPTAGLDGPRKVYVRDMMDTKSGWLRYKCQY